MNKTIYKSVCTSYEKNINENSLGISNYCEDLTLYDNDSVIACLLSKEIYNYSKSKLKNFTIYEKVSGLVYGIYIKNETEAFVSFKGTSSLSDVIADINYVKVDDTYDIPGKFHKGFHDLILLDGTVEKIFNSIPLNIKKIYITGHSLGAALATIFYAYAKTQNIETELITFGSPRLGDLEFSKFLSDKSCKRYVNGSDIITKIPYFGFFHVKNKIQLGSSKSVSPIRDHDIDNYLSNIF